MKKLENGAMVQNVLYSHNSDEWETPQWFFDELNGRYHFDLDVCSTRENRKCLRYFTKQDDGLSRKWGGARVVQSSVF